MGTQPPFTSGELTEWEDVVEAWTCMSETEGLRGDWRTELLTIISVLIKSSIFDCVVVTADIGPEFGDVRPLNTAQMRTLSVNSVHLLDLIDSNTAFVSELASPTLGVITWSQRQHLVEMIHSRDRNDKLLELLTRRSVADFQKFTRVLSKYQPHLVPLLVTDGGEKLCA